MISNAKIYPCACDVRGQRHVFTTDASGTHILMVDPSNVHLLRDASWTVAPVHRTNATKLQARAATRAPGIRKGRVLHRLASKVRNGKKRIRAISGNLLDARKANLQCVSRSDIAILSRCKPIGKLIGVRYAVPPKWLRTDCHYHCSVSIDGVKVHLGSYRSKEEGACAVDAALRRLHGKDATTNEGLGFISADVARTKLCRRAAKVARNKVREYQQGLAVQKMKALVAANTQKEKLAIFRSMAARPKVQVAMFA